MKQLSKWYWGIQYLQYWLYFIFAAAEIKAKNKGCGFNGRDLNSG